MNAQSNPSVCAAAPARGGMPNDLPAATALPWGASLALRALRGLRHGQIELRLPDGHTVRFGSAGSAGKAEGMAHLHVHDALMFPAVMRHGDIGFAESYIQGLWSTPDLPALLRLLVANRATLERLIHGGRVGAWLHRVRHALRRNSRAGSRRNIHAHYDLGNDFYRLWLDAGLNYSSAWFVGDMTQSLAQAQANKMHRALAQCAVRPGERLLEIGCGWGGLAELACRGVGARVTGITLSSEQLAWARERLEQAGLSAEFHLQDYRDLAGEPFDAVVSIEMFEAVGRAYWPGYFATLHRMLKPGGRACIQSIVIRDDLFERYARGSDFIQQYIFPGGMLPSPSVFRSEARRAGLQVVDEFAFGADYAETLRRWRERFLAEQAQVRALKKFDTRFIRTWDFYLTYCEAAFMQGDTDVIQFTLQRT